MSSSLPIGWKLEPLGQLAQVVSGGTPSRYVPEFWRDGTIPWVTPTDITNTGGRYLSESCEGITELGLQSCSAKKLPPGALLMTSRATLGEVRIALREVCTNQGFKSLIPFRGVNGHFLYYQIGLNKERYKGFGIGSTFLEVNKRDTERFELLVAPEPEQRLIAEILSTVDEAIEQTEALIAKYQQIKAGLMHDLFTRGLSPEASAKGDGTWTLRPTREQAPHLYKESPLGWIPKEWEVITVEDCAAKTPGSSTIGPFGSDLLSTDYRNVGVPVVFVRDVKEDGFEWNSGVYVTLEKATQLAAHSVKPGDILSTKMGLPPCISCTYPSWMDQGIITADIIRLRPDVSEVDNRWLSLALNGEAFRRQVQAITAGVTRPKVTLSDFRKIWFPRPLRKEQAMMVDRMESVANLVSRESLRSAKLQKLKHGLMHDLLTGRVRVKVPETASI